MLAVTATFAVNLANLPSKAAISKMISQGMESSAGLASSCRRHESRGAYRVFVEGVDDDGSICSENVT
jgi:hypothetical protein